MRPTKKRLEQQLSSLCGETTSREAGTFVRKCRQWLKLEKNQDRRGTTAGAIGKAYYACLWFKEAQRAQAHQDSTVRRVAKKAVRGNLHKEFPQIQKDLAKLHGQVSKAGKRLADQRERAAERTIDLDSRFELRELRSMTSAKPVGQCLRNCLARKSDAPRLPEAGEGWRDRTVGAGEDGAPGMFDLDRYSDSRGRGTGGKKPENPPTKATSGILASR